MLQNRALRHGKQRNVGSGWIKEEKLIKTAMTEDKCKQFEESAFGHLGFFQRWQLGVE